MKTSEIRQKYIQFWKDRGHTIIPSAPLVPENDPTTLFTGSGMQPLIPYLLGQRHPSGKRLVNSQKSFRAEDIEEVGDNRHTTFFEMLGNWSLGDYFKEEQLKGLFSFLTDVVGLDPKKLYVTVFVGSEDYAIVKDTESAILWKNLFQSKGVTAEEKFMGSLERASATGMSLSGADNPNIKSDTNAQVARIFYYDAKKNWWSRTGAPEKMPVGEPGGPDSEVFYEFTDISHDSRFGAYCHPNCDCGRYLEIGNSVFMEYKKTVTGFEKLAQRNVDFGGGLERIAAASISTPDVFKIDVLKAVVEKLEQLSLKSYQHSLYQKSMRIVTDHLRAAVFLISDSVLPSNTDQGYFVRRLIRRSVRHLDILGIQYMQNDATNKNAVTDLLTTIIDLYKDAYPELDAKKTSIVEVIQNEMSKFRKTLHHALSEFQSIEKKSAVISGASAFTLFTSYGLPIDMTVELAAEKNKKVDTAEFEKLFKEHQTISRKGAEKKFKGGLADTSEMSVKYHTATHLLHQALRQVLGPEVRQKGSNITAERLRFDFSYDAKMTDEQKRETESIVNKIIKQNLPVRRLELNKEEAEKTGALHFFGEKYGDIVSVYFIGPDLEHAFSKEFCGGPHVTETGTLGTFKIVKEEAVSQGVRRIKAILE